MLLLYPTQETEFSVYMMLSDLHRHIWVYISRDYLHFLVLTDYCLCFEELHHLCMMRASYFEPFPLQDCLIYQKIEKCTICKKKT